VFNLDLLPHVAARCVERAVVALIGTVDGPCAMSFALIVPKSPLVSSMHDQ
jgi:hypothetical protein